MKGEGVWTSLKMGTLMATLEPRRRRMLAARVLVERRQNEGRQVLASSQELRSCRGEARKGAGMNVREPDVLVDDLVAHKQRLHRPPFSRCMRVAERRVGHSQSRPAGEGHRQLVRSEVLSGELSSARFSSQSCSMYAREARRFHRQSSKTNQETKRSEGGTNRSRMLPSTPKSELTVTSYGAPGVLSSMYLPNSG